MPNFRNPDEFVGLPVQDLAAYLDAVDQSLLLRQWQEQKEQSPAHLYGTMMGGPTVDVDTSVEQGSIRFRAGEPPGFETLSVTRLSAYRDHKIDADIPYQHPPITIPNVEIIRHLGGGAFGSVFAGRVLSSGLQVAIKVLKSPGFVDLSSAAATEAINASKVRHPNVMRVFDLRRVGELWIIVLEFVAGDPLSRRLMREREIGRIFRQLADAVAHFQTQGILHRDIKPANIVLRHKTRSPVIVDLGLSVDLNVCDPELIEVAGTPYFMSPEALCGHLDVSQDAYSLGVTAASILLDDTLPKIPNGQNLRIQKANGEFQKLLLDRIANRSFRIDGESWLTGIRRWFQGCPVNANWIGRLLSRDTEQRSAAVAATRAWRL